jgi:hypothetical protein
LGTWEAGDTVNDPLLEPQLLASSAASWMRLEEVLTHDEVHVTTSVEPDDKMIRRGKPRKVQDADT